MFIEINQRKTTLVLLLGLLPSFVNAQSDEFQKQLRYLEKTTANHYLPDEGDVHCLTSGELAQFSSSQALSEVVETIDLEGELLSDRTIVFEDGVRDDWMDSYHRIEVGREYVSIYAEDGSVIEQIEREEDPETLFTEQEAESYQRYSFNEEDLNQFREFLELEGFAVSDQGGVLQGSSETAMVHYNPFAKSVTTALYDSFGVKRFEQAIEFERQESDYFFPVTDTKIEWITTETGCCVKKVTVISRFDIQEAVFSSEPFAPNPEEADFDIKIQEDYSSFTVTSKRFRLRPIEIKVYDLSGHTLVHTKVREGQPVSLPTEIRAGMYLVHIISANRHKPVVGKLIKPQSGTKL